MDKTISIEKALDHVKDGDSIMYGGFGPAGFPSALVEELAKRDLKDLTVIAEDMGGDSVHTSALFKDSKKVRNLLTSYPRRNEEIQRRYFENDFDFVEVMPMGTFVERIRCGGSGIAAFLTRAGLNTDTEIGKEKMTVDGKEYLLETALKANIALVYANKADKWGNLVINGRSKNFNVVMAMAADFVIAQAFDIVEVGDIDPDDVTIPAVLVDAVVKVEESVYGI